jgi:hypothetical protein
MPSELIATAAVHPGQAADEWEVLQPLEQAGVEVEQAGVVVVVGWSRGRVIGIAHNVLM